MPPISSYAFTTAGRSACDSSRYGYGRRHNNDHDAEKDQAPDAGDGSYAAQYIGGAPVGSDMGALGGVGLFGAITDKGVQTDFGTIAGLGLGPPMSRLYAQ
jgi:hypothetical protein